MSALTTTIDDTVTFFRRDLLHQKRFPIMTISAVGMPLFMLLLFVYVFGGAIGAGVGDALGSGEYLDYVIPGILVMTVGGGGSATAINVTTDMNEGVIARFRTMRVARGAVIGGQVLGSIVRTASALVAVIVAALALGFRPTAGPLEWLGAIGVLALLTLAVTWLTVAIGLSVKSAAAANSLSLPFQFFPFISSAFVSTATMAAGPAWVAEHQPFTPIIDTLRSLLLGTPMGDSWCIAVLWCVAGSLIGLVWSLRAFERLPSRGGPVSPLAKL
jgi:ABC-2 type transport system permease protein